MRKVLIITYLLVGAFLNCNSQVYDTIYLKNLKLWQVKGMSKSAIRMGDSYQARDFLNEWHQRDPQNPEVSNKLAYYLLKARDYENAGSIFSKLSVDYPDKYPETRFYHAQILKINGDYEEALTILQQLRSRIRRLSGTGITKFRLDNEIAGCHLGIASRDTIVKTEVSWLNKSINSPHIEYGPVLIGESTFVYGSVSLDSTRMISVDAPYSANRQFYEAKKVNDVWMGGFEPNPPFINLPDFDTGRGAFSVDRKRFYTVQCSLNKNGQNICHLYVSQLEEGEWTTPIKLDRNVNHPKFNSTHPTVGTCFSSSLEIIYFVSDRKGGAGGQDIWFSVYDKSTKQYKKAENAGVFINSAVDEITPFFDLPSHRLYFSSNGWKSLGGFDIFFAKGDMTTWDSPVNIGVPINSSFDDLNFVQNHSGKFGVIASNRPGSLSLHHQACCDDLYAFNETESPRVLVTGRLVKEDVVKESGIFNVSETIDNVDIDSISEPDLLRNQSISVQMVRDSSSSVLLQEIVTNALGEFEMWVEPGMDYQLTVNDTTLIDRNYSFSTRDAAKDEILNISTISMSSVNDNAIVIDNIYYEFNQTELTAQAKQALDSTLLLLLVRYPGIQVEISSHTDDVGDEGYNMRLSLRRANGVLQYLVSMGIDKKRLSAKGYGELQPLHPNVLSDGTDNPIGREKNRRTEFKITGLTENSLKIN